LELDAEKERSRRLALESEVEKLHHDNLAAQISLEQERQSRLAIEQKMAWRSLTKDQKDEIVRRLLGSKFETVTVVSTAGDVESAAFARQIIAVLMTAGLDVRDSIGGNLMFGPPTSGISLSVDPKRTAEAEAIAEALVHADVAKRPVPASNAQPGSGALSIVVGPKP